ncbi:MAG: hypothetical protein WCP70_13995 [Methanothrix sp.]
MVKTAFTLLDNLLSALTGNAALSAMVDAKIYKNKPLEKSDVDLRNAVNKSLISCEAQDISGQLVASDPIFAVDIRSRKGTDGGAEYCAEIADVIRIILDDGFTGAEVLKVQGDVAFDKNLAAYRCRLEVFCHVKVSYILSLTPSIASPQGAGQEIIFVAAATPSQGLEYRFLVNGPGTGSASRDMTGWQSRNSFAWRTSDQDVGASVITVQVRGGPSKGAADQSTTANYTITATSAGTGTAPEISSLTPSLASPQEEQTKIDFICVATDADSNPILYRFFLTGPGTANVKMLVQDWSHKNAWQWQPQTVDVGESTIEVQIRDGLHAKEGSYDDNATASYTVTAIAGIGTAPTITSLAPRLASPQPPGTEIEIIATAAGPNGVELLYKFWHKPPGANWKDLSPWGTQNWIRWIPTLADSGTNSIRVDVIDGLHAERGSYDATSTISYTISP